MPLSWNEIRDRALKFSREWADESSEDAEAKTFWDGFFNVFGVTRRRVASFEQPVKKADGKGGFIDLLWKGILLVEHKSRGKDLDRAFKQATDYFPGLRERDLPKYVLVSDFACLRLHDLDSGEQKEFALADLHKHVALFGFIAGYQVRAFKDQDPANIRAAERMGALHDALKASGYAGHELEVLLVRLLFCLFAEDTGIFERRQFQDFIEQRTADDGSDLGARLAELFHALNTPRDRRQKTLDESVAAFEYVNGKLFSEPLPPAAFDRPLREALLDAAGMDWGTISPAIFGALFQSIMDAKARRNLGAHYTSEKNILKLIGPLFMDDLRAEFDKIRNSRAKLHDFHEKIAALKFLDPACGCGNFLVIAYRELRLLEHEILQVMYRKELDSGQVLDPRQLLKCNVDQFYGIEIEEFPAQIARVALWLTDHQMNLRVQEAFGNRYVRLPLTAAATIVHGNALRIDWNEVVPAAQLSYILGNPPFGGKHYQSKEQRADQAVLTAEIKSGSDLDFVANWFIKAGKYIAGTSISVAFVATNSITQGEQVSLLWGYMLNHLHVSIYFAHRTFKWSNEARGKAAVHCVIVGFSLQHAMQCRLFDYAHPDDEPHEIAAKRINPYLVDGPNIVITKRSQPLTDSPSMRYGNKPSDDGQFILLPEERKALLTEEPAAKKWIKRYVGSEDFINGIERWCLWLKGIRPDELRQMPVVLSRVEAVRRFRSASSAEPTRKSANTPAEFFYISQPDTPYVVVPEVSSERRKYIPIGFLPSEVICSNTNYLIPDATLYTFGLLTSAMHMAWIGVVCGRLESRYRYSGSIVYNNFPWPELPLEPLSHRERGRGEGPGSDRRHAVAEPSSGALRHLLPTGEGNKHHAAIESAAQGVLDARAKFPDATLADLYDPLTMPPALVKAHQALDRAVDAAYVAAEKAAGRKPPKLGSDAERVAFLFERYQALTSLLPSAKSKRTARKSRKVES